jgi:uncharacterized membrane protein HdeD (DUF308 family)
MSDNTFKMLFGAAFSCAGVLLILFNRTTARRALDWQRWMLERPWTPVMTRILYVLVGLFWIIFGILTMLGQTIK